MLSLAGCGRKSETGAERTALLPFANLTGDPSLDWVAQAAPLIAGVELAGSRVVLPLRAASMSEAYESRASRIVHGTYSKRGAVLVFDVEVEDTARHKMVRTTSARGDIVSAMSQFSRALDPAGATAFPTSNTEAAEAWGRQEFERATMLDPDFGTAWRGWAQTLASANEPRALEIVNQALARPSLRSLVERAQIELLAATLRRDVEGRRKALLTLTQTAPMDPVLEDTLAELELNARQFKDAAGHYRRAQQLDPGNPGAGNLLGYALAFSGDLDASRRAFEEYATQPGQKTNALDSLGEAYFVNGKFTEAEKYFMQAYESNRNLLGGVDLAKAAYARWLSGDLKMGDKIEHDYLAMRAKLGDQLVVWREARWLYSTGRKDQAMALLQNPAPSIADLAARQLPVWRGDVKPPGDLAGLKTLYDATSPFDDAEVRTFYASALIAAGRKSEAAKLLMLWPLPEGGGEPMLQSLVYPTFIEARKAAGIR